LWFGFITILVLVFILGFSGNVFADIQQRLPTNDILTEWDTTFGGGGTHYGAVDDPIGVPDNNSSYINTGTASDWDMFGYSAFSVPAGATISQVSVVFVATDSVWNGNNRMEAALRVNGTDYKSTANYNPSNQEPTYDAPFTYNWATNPATALPWTVDDVNGIGANPIEGFGVTSEDASPPLRVTQVYIEVTYTVPSSDALTASNNTNLTTGDIVDDTTGNDMQRFQVDCSNVDDGSCWLSSLDIQDDGNATSLTAYVYIDTVSQATLPGTATLLGQTSGWDGSATTIGTFTDAAREVQFGTPKYIYIVYDVPAGQAGNTVQSNVTAVDVDAPDTGYGAVGTSTLRNVICVPQGAQPTIADIISKSGNPIEVCSDVSENGAQNVMYQIDEIGTATITHVGSSAVTHTSTNTLTINKPAGTIENDVMLAAITIRSGSEYPSLPAGWAVVPNTQVIDTSGNPDTRSTVAWKRAGASEPASYDFTHSWGTESSGAISTFRGVIESGSPIDASSGLTDGTSDAIVSATSITTTVADTMVVFTSHVGDDWTHNSGSWSATDPSSFTQAFDGGSASGDDRAIALAYAIKSSTGATGLGTVTISAADPAKVGTLIALIPATTTNVLYGPNASCSGIDTTGWTDGGTLTLTVTSDDGCGTPFADATDDFIWNAAAAAGTLEFTSPRMKVLGQRQPLRYPVRVAVQAR
jgi:hypothetical protein